MMRSILPVVFAFALTVPLHAAGNWDDVAAGFGCTQKIQEGEQANGGLYQMEYLPKGQAAGSHSRIFPSR